MLYIVALSIGQECSGTGRRGQAPTSTAMFRFLKETEGGTFARKSEIIPTMDMDWDDDYDGSEVVGSKTGKGIVAPGQTVASSLEFMR